MMKNSQENYIENLSLFSQLLRDNGLPSGIKETIDAARIIEIIGLYDRKVISQALSTIYAKSEREQRIFSECFDQFFVGKNDLKEQIIKQKKAEEEKSRNYEEAMKDLQYEGRSLDIRDEIKEKYANLPEQERKQLMQYLNFSMQNRRNSPFYERFMVKSIEQRLSYADYPNENSNTIAEDMSDLLYKNLSDITEEEIPRVISLIQLLVKKINGAISRDFKKNGKSGRLDFRGTIHSSLRTGGSFYKLIYKKRRHTKKRIILLCDVSGSMLKFSHFAIRFIKSLSDVANSSETYLFSENVLKVSPFVLNNMKTFETYVKDSGLWGKGTDIGKAIEELNKIGSSHITSSTILLIISDTKTIGINTAQENLKQISKKTGRIIWMNPVPTSNWNNMKSVNAFKPYCQMLDCSTLNNLAKACSRLI